MPNAAVLDALNPKHRRFAEEYVVDFHGTKAAIRAGYSKRSARIQASQLLAKPNIQEAVQFLAQRVSAKLEFTQERVLREIARGCFSDLRKLYSPRGRRLKPHELDDDTAAAVAGYEMKDGVLKVRFCSKTEALNMAGRYFKLFKEDLPTQPQGGMYVLLAPATATPTNPDEWMKLVQKHAGAVK